MTDPRGLELTTFRLGAEHATDRATGAQTNFHLNADMTLTFDLVTLTLGQLARLINIYSICKYHKIHPSVHDLWAKNTRCKRANIHTDRPTNIQTKAVKY